MMEDKNLIDELYDGMLNIVLAALISSDTLTDVESCQESLRTLAALERDFQRSTHSGDTKIRDVLDKARSVIIRDLNQLKIEASK